MARTTKEKEQVRAVREMIADILGEVMVAEFQKTFADHAAQDIGRRMRELGALTWLDVTNRLAEPIAEALIDEDITWERENGGA